MNENPGFVTVELGDRLELAFLPVAWCGGCGKPRPHELPNAQSEAICCTECGTWRKRP